LRQESREAYNADTRTLNNTCFGLARLAARTLRKGKVLIHYILITKGLYKKEEEGG